MASQNQTPLEESDAAKWENLQKSRAAALDDCWAACETEELDKFKSQVERSYHQLGEANINTLLRRTVKKGWVDGIRCLLERGADPNIIPPSLIARDATSVAILQLLTEFGVDFKSGEENILVYVTSRREILDWLLDQGLDINAGGNRTLKGTDKLYRDNTVAVLNSAAGSGDIALFDHLVARGAKASQSNALHNASRSQNAAAIITHLVKNYQLDVNAGDDCGGLNELVKWDVTPGSPLNYAVTYSNLPAIETLLKYNSDIGSSWGIAIQKQNTPALKILLKAGADASEALGYAITDDYLKGAQLCLEHGADIATGEARDKMVTGFGGMYTGMSTEMRKLIDQWKGKRRDSQG